MMCVIDQMKNNLKFSIIKLFHISNLDNYVKITLDKNFADINSKSLMNQSTKNVII